MNFFLTPFRFVKDKTRPWRRRRHEIKNRMKELEKIARLNAEISAWKVKNEILEQSRYKDDKRLLKYGFKAYSQFDEDGIIQEIFRRIGVTNKTFLEIGVGEVKTVMSEIMDSVHGHLDNIDLDNVLFKGCVFKNYRMTTTQDVIKGKFNKCSFIDCSNSGLLLSKSVSSIRNRNSPPLFFI